MDFKLTITAGQMLEIITLVIGGVGMYYRLGEKIDKIAGKVMALDVKYQPVYSWWERHVNNGNGRTRPEGAD